MITVVIGTDEIWATLIFLCSFWFDHFWFLAFFQHLKSVRNVKNKRKYLASWFLGTGGKAANIAIDTDTSSFTGSVGVEFLATSELKDVLEEISSNEK